MHCKTATLADKHVWNQQILKPEWKWERKTFQHAVKNISASFPAVTAVTLMKNESAMWMLTLWYSCRSTVPSAGFCTDVWKHQGGTRAARSLTENKVLIFFLNCVKSFWRLKLWGCLVWCELAVCVRAVASVKDTEYSVTLQHSCYFSSLGVKF